MDDYISRQAALDAAVKLAEARRRWGTSEGQAQIRGIDALMCAIEGLPSAQPKQGRWEYVDYGGFGNWHCTACRNICICNGDFDFCPNCGARMDEGSEE